MDDLLSEFLTETTENLSVLDVELVRLEQNPNDPELLGNIFRLVHTIKGTCGFLGLPRLESVAHAGENVLGKIRDGDLEVTPKAISLVLAALDRIKIILAALEQTEAEPEGDDKELIIDLNALADAAEGGAPAPKAEAQAAPEPEAAPAQTAAEVPAAPATLFERIGGTAAVNAAVDLFYRKVLADDRISHFFDSVDMDAQRGKQKAFLTMAFGGPNSYTGKDLQTAHAPLVAKGLNDSHFDAVAEHLKATLDELGVAPDITAEVMAIAGSTRDDVLSKNVAKAVPAAAIEEAIEDQPAAKPAAAGKAAKAPAGGEAVGAKESAVAAHSIRVNVDLLENLMTMVSELVLTRNQLLQILRNQKESDFGAPLQRLNHITSELQEGVMKTRMQPIGNAWAKLPRLVRDLGIELDKKIDLEMLGAETELDRQVLELIKDPLTHMVRNSADHGVERPEVRRAAGKPETGKVTLNAYHEGGHIIIEVKDNGAGLSVERLKAKALTNGLASQTELDAMSDQQIFQFIFKAGFSTAAKVTSVSGRGVGMDVVRTNIEKIGGTVELKSVEGKGTTFVIKIPLTLAIVSALIVECRGERFAIPQISVLELVRASSKSETAIETINNTPVLRLRNRLLPLVSLRDLLRLSDTPGSGNADRPDDNFIVVTQVGNYTFGIIVDRVFDTEEIVVKPVAPILRDISIFSGNTILGDGSVIMILDPNGIAAASGEVILTDHTGREGEAARETGGAERVALLLFRAGGAAPKAVPLSLIARLEEIKLENIEFSQGRPMVQYRGHLMPLVTITDDYKLKETGRQPVLVFSDRDRTMGLVVDEIVDIVEETLSVELSTDKAGMIGSSIVAGKATDLIDAAHFLTRAFGDWFTPKTARGKGRGRTGKRVLIVDDSPFFLNLLTPLLATAGYDVTTAENGDQAMKLCEEGRDFDAIISDIEMPGMDGFAFAKAVKTSSRWKETPIVALSSHTSREDLDRGREVGFDDYVPKFDRDALLNALSETLAMERGAA
ncbi:MAG: chemotaxis protein CheW [Alphaproteobacteria bacterium]